MTDNYYSEGALQTLDLDELEVYAPDYYQRLKDTLGTYGQIDSSPMFLFAERNQIYYNYIKLIRKNWLDQLGMEVPQNIMELYQAAEAWQEAGLGVIGDRLHTKSFTFEYGYIPEDHDQQEVALYLDLNVASFTWEVTRQYLKTMNEGYYKGLIDPEFYLNKNETDEKANCPEAELAVLETNVPLPSGIENTGRHYQSGFYNCRREFS